MKKFKNLKTNQNLEFNAEIEEERLIIKGLLSKARSQALQKLQDELIILLKDLSNSAADIFNMGAYGRQQIASSYYAIHFETIDLNLDNNEWGSICFALGLDHQMNQNLLGFWFRANSEHDYQFWIRVCKELKDLGIDEVKLKYDQKLYWLSEAMHKVFD